MNFGSEFTLHDSDDEEEEVTEDAPAGLLSSMSAGMGPFPGQTLNAVGAAGPTQTSPRILQQRGGAAPRSGLTGALVGEVPRTQANVRFANGDPLGLRRMANPIAGWPDSTLTMLRTQGRFDRSENGPSQVWEGATAAAAATGPSPGPVGGRVPDPPAPPLLYQSHDYASREATLGRHEIHGAMPRTWVPPQQYHQGGQHAPRIPEGQARRIPASHIEAARAQPQYARQTISQALGQDLTEEEPILPVPARDNPGGVIHPPPVPGTHNRVAERRGKKKGGAPPGPQLQRTNAAPPASWLLPGYPVLQPGQAVLGEAGVGGGPDTRGAEAPSGTPDQLVGEPPAAAPVAGRKAVPPVPRSRTWTRKVRWARLLLLLLVVYVYINIIRSMFV